LVAVSKKDKIEYRRMGGGGGEGLQGRVKWGYVRITEVEGAT